MRNKIKSESDNKMKFIAVKVLNNPSDGFENFFRTATGNNTGSLLRPAILAYNSTELELGFRDDLSNYKLISKMYFDNIGVVKHKPNAISLMNQLLKPALKGFIIGCGIILISLFGGKLAIGGLGMIGIIAFTTIFWSVGALSKMEKISIIIIEGSDSSEIEFAVNSSSFNLFSKLMKEKNIEIQYYNKPTFKESILSLTDNAEIGNKLIELNTLIELHKKKGMFGKNHQGEICSLLEGICKSKNDAQIVINEYFQKFNSNLIEDLMKLSSSYNSIKEFLHVFIELDVVEKNYPHAIKY